MIISSQGEDFGSEINKVQTPDKAIDTCPSGPDTGAEAEKADRWSAAGSMAEPFGIRRLALIGYVILFCGLKKKSGRVDGGCQLD